MFYFIRRTACDESQAFGPSEKFKRWGSFYCWCSTDKPCTHRVVLENWKWTQMWKEHFYNPEQKTFYMWPIGNIKREEAFSTCYSEWNRALLNQSLIFLCSKYSFHLIDRCNYTECEGLFSIHQSPTLRQPDQAWFDWVRMVLGGRVIKGMAHCLSHNSWGAQ